MLKLIAEDRSGGWREIPPRLLPAYFRLIERWTGCDRATAERLLRSGAAIELALSTGDLKIWAEAEDA